MDDSALTAEPSATPFADAFWDQFPVYLFFGMTREEYWELDPWLTVVYRRLYDLKRDQASFDMWIQGMYNFDAFGVVLENAFKDKGAKPSKYIEKPMLLRELTLAEKQKEKKEQEEKIIAALNRMKSEWNNKKET